jgi:hypothetical protein
MNNNIRNIKIVDMFHMSLLHRVRYIQKQKCYTHGQICTGFVYGHDVDLSDWESPSPVLARSHAVARWLPTYPVKKSHTNLP